MKKQNKFISMGILSLFLIFTVFCMVILCLLTYNTSRSDLLSARHSLNQTTAYYNACTQITELSVKLNQQLCESTSSCTSETDFYQTIETLSFPESVLYKEESQCFSIRIPFSETQELYAEFDLVYPPEQDTYLSTKIWKSQITGKWNPDMHQNVYLEGENS